MRRTFHTTSRYASGSNFYTPAPLSKFDADKFYKKIYDFSKKNSFKILDTHTFSAEAKEAC